MSIHLRGDYSKIADLAEELRQTSFCGEFWAVERRGEPRVYSRPAVASADAD